MYPYHFLHNPNSGFTGWYKIMSLQITFANMLELRMKKDGWKNIPYMGEDSESSIKKVIDYVDWLRASRSEKSDSAKETVEELYERMKKEFGNE